LDRLLGRLAGGIAHDFNNLLQVINGYVELALGELPSAHPSLDHLSQVGTAARRATDLVRQLLTFSRRDAFAPRAVDLNELVADLMRMLVRLIGEQVEVVVRPADSLPAISADPVQVRQVLINLCVNARDAMPEGGRILVATAAVRLDERFCAENGLRRAGTYVRMEVSDNGAGIPPEIRERIFEPFFTTKEVGKGTGLGLATVYGIMQQHEGLIQVDSEVGRGTLVRVFFPGAEQPSETAESRADASPVSGAGRTVLLAEDERQVRELATRVLERAGYHVIATVDGEEALRAYEEHAGDIDLALLDLVMPKMGGGAVRDRLRAMRADLPILVATGYGRDQLSRAFVPAAQERLLNKPWTSQQLLSAIEQLLERPAATGA
jgi:CheY-like chemotaxis protein